MEPRRPDAHLSFNVRNTQKWYDYLVSKGVECVSKPERSPRGHSFFFAKDFDGNLIEMIDLGYMYYVLGWLGPLGGWIFRRGMYKQVLLKRLGVYAYKHTVSSKNRVPDNRNRRLHRFHGCAFA